MLSAALCIYSVCVNVQTKESWRFYSFTCFCLVSLGKKNLGCYLSWHFTAGTIAERSFELAVLQARSVISIMTPPTSGYMVCGHAERAQTELIQSMPKTAD